MLRLNRFIIEHLKFENDSLRETTERVATENEELRKLLRLYREYVDQDRCTGCCLRKACLNGDVEMCYILDNIRFRENELHLPHAEA